MAQARIPCDGRMPEGCAERFERLIGQQAETHAMLQDVIRRLDDGRRRDEALLDWQQQHAMRLVVLENWRMRSETGSRRWAGHAITLIKGTVLVSIGWALSYFKK